MKQQHCEYYTGGNDAAVKINGKITQGWIVKQIVCADSGFLVLFEKETMDSKGEFVTTIPKTFIYGDGVVK